MLFQKRRDIGEKQGWGKKTFIKFEYSSESIENPVFECHIIENAVRKSAIYRKTTNKKNKRKHKKKIRF